MLKSAKHSVPVFKNVFNNNTWRGRWREEWRKRGGILVMERRGVWGGPWRRRRGRGRPGPKAEWKKIHEWNTTTTTTTTTKSMMMMVWRGGLGRVYTHTPMGVSECVYEWMNEWKRKRWMSSERYVSDLDFSLGWASQSMNECQSDRPSVRMNEWMNEWPEPTTNRWQFVGHKQTDQPRTFGPNGGVRWEYAWQDQNQNQPSVHQKNEASWVWK